MNGELMMSEVDPKEFGAALARIEMMGEEMHKMRESVEKLQRTLDRGQGGLMVLMFAAGAIGSTVVFFIKKILGIQ